MKYDRKGKAENKKRSQKLRRKPTGPENHLYSLVKRAKQRRVLKRWHVGRIIPHIGLPYRNLLIILENETGHLTREKYDSREKWLLSKGFNVVRVTEKMVYEDPKSIIEAIEKYAEAEENRAIFFTSRRAANKQSYWIDEEEK